MNRLNRLFRRARAASAAALAALMVASGTAASAQQETPPAPSAPRSVAVPKPVEATLKNGLRVVVVELKNMPLVTAKVIMRNGGEVDPPQLSGLADMTASLLTKGTKTRTAPQIAQAIEALGGSLESGAGWDSSSVTTGVMSSKISQAMEILADVVRNPAFQNEEIERLRQQYLDSLSVALNQPGTVANMVAARVVFGDEPYGHPASGTPESLPRIKRDDIVRLHSTHYRPDNTILVVGGDIRSADAFKLAERLFGDWAKPSAPLTAAAKEDKARAEGKQRVVVIDMPEAGQAAVVLARSGIRRTDPQYFQGIVANSVLGGGYSARLNQEIRIKRGLSYGAGSSLSVRREVGPFLASTQTKNPSGAEVASLLMSELGRLSSEPLLDAELTPRKAVLIGNFGRSLETTEGVVNQIGSLANYGLGLDQINSYIQNVQTVSGGDVQKFAGSRLASQGASIIIAGNAKEFLDALRKQFQNVEVIPLAELDLNSATLRKVVGSRQ